MFNGNTRFHRDHYRERRHLVRTILTMLIFAIPGMVQAQVPGGPTACGGSSTVDALGAKTAAGARDFLAQLQTAVQSNNKEQIADMIDYPLLVIRDEKRTRITRKEAFVANYDRILTAPVRDAILHQTAQCLFGNSSGAMVGRGELWFREQAADQWKIITVNDSILAP